MPFTARERFLFHTRDPKDVQHFFIATVLKAFNPNTGLAVLCCQGREIVMPARVLRKSGHRVTLRVGLQLRICYESDGQGGWVATNVADIMLGSRIQRTRFKRRPKHREDLC